MDATWFAIDKDGYVGHFSTGEAGALPERAYTTENTDFIENQLAQVGIQCEPIYDYQGRRRPGMHHILSIFGGPMPDQMMLVFVKSMDLIQQAVTEGHAREVRSTSGHAVLWRGMTQEDYDRLEANEHLLGMDHLFFFDGIPETLATRGVYSYSHTCENWIAGPYGRQELPSVPLHVDQLPPEVRRLLKQCRFDQLSFAETVHLQPVEIFPCQSWEDRYLGMDGKQYSITHPGIPINTEDDDEDDDDFLDEMSDPNDLTEEVEDEDDEDFGDIIDENPPTR
jgi:hypothetical protein